MANCISKSNRSSNRGRRARKQERKPRNTTTKKKTITNLTITRLKKVAPETKPNQNQKTETETKHKSKSNTRKEHEKKRKNNKIIEKNEEVIGKTIITITNNRDKDKTQPHDLQLTMTRLLVYLNDIKYYKLSCK